MKITVNNETATIKLTDDIMSLEKQFEEFLEDWEKIEAVYKIEYSPTFDKYKHDVIQKGLDAVKSGYKYVLMLSKDVLDEFLLKESILCHTEMFDVAEMTIQNFIKDNTNYTKGNLTIFNLVLFLKEFCLENDESLFKHIKTNNERANQTDSKKIYLSDEDLKYLKEIAEFLTFDLDDDKLQKIINRIEE